METPILRAGRRALAACPPATRALRSKRRYATAQDDIRAAPPIRFNNNDANQFSRPRAEFIHDDDDAASPRRSRGGHNHHHEIDYFRLLRHARIVPASPSYFTATPKYTDDLLAVSALLRRHELLPVLPPGTAPRVAWKSLLQYKTELAEPIRAKAYAALVQVLRRLNFIHPALMPAEVTAALAKFKRDV
ncbi:37S ribosomal protein S9, mitochondrial, partial [Teratosphaeria destructans]